MANNIKVILCDKDNNLEIDVDGELDLTNISISPTSFTGGVKAQLPKK